jgi:hypothetical protein
LDDSGGTANLAVVGGNLPPTSGFQSVPTKEALAL